MRFRDFSIKKERNLFGGQWFLFMYFLQLNVILGESRQWLMLCSGLLSRHVMGRWDGSSQEWEYKAIGYRP